MQKATSTHDRAKPRGSDVPRTTTRGPSGRSRLGGRACERAERLLLLCCRNCDLLLRKRVLDYQTWERRDLALRRAAEATQREMVGGAA